MKAVFLALCVLMFGLGSRLEAQIWAEDSEHFLFSLLERDSISQEQALDSFLRLNPPKPEQALELRPIPSLVRDDLGKRFCQKVLKQQQIQNEPALLAHYTHLLGMYAVFTGSFDLAQIHYEDLLKQIASSKLNPRREANYIKHMIWFYAGNLHNYNKALNIVENHRKILGQEVYALLIEIYTIKQDWAKVRDYTLIHLEGKPQDQEQKLNLATALWHLGLRDSCKQVITKIDPKEVSFSPYLQFKLSLLYYHLNLNLDFNFIEALQLQNGHKISNFFLIHHRGMDYALEKQNKQDVLLAITSLEMDTIWNKDSYSHAKINSLLAKGWAFLGQDSIALKLVQKAWQMLESESPEERMIIDKQLSFEILVTENQILNKQSNQAKALERNLQKLLPLLDELRLEQHSPIAKQNFIQKQLDLIETALDYFYLKYQENQDLQWLEQGLMLSEKTKALILLDALREDQALSFGRLPDSLRQLERNLQQSIRQLQVSYNKNLNTSLFQELESREQQLHQLKHYLEEQYPDYFRLKYQEIQISLGKIQDQAQKQNLGILHYFLGKQSLHVFYLDGQKSNWAKTRIDNSFNTLILQTYTQLSDAEQVLSQNSVQETQLKQQLRELYLLLTQGLDPSKFPEKLLIVPDGGLHYLPFEVFLTEDQPQQDWSKQAYWIQKHSFQYQYTLGLWLELLGRNNSAKGGILGLAPNYLEGQKLGGIREQLHDLRGAEQELNYLKQHFQGQYFYQEQASEAKFKELLPQASIVHLAMHGLINDQNPERSALIFQHQDPQEDNILYAYEIPALQTEGELIVLSACQTGFGQYQRGEGLLSLSRGFVYAGFPAIVSTLWAINDQASYHLMAGFYGHLSEGRTKSEALRQTKLAYLKRAEASLAAHPFFWAGFVFHGQDRPCQNLHRVWSWYWAWAVLGLGFGAYGLYRRRARDFHRV